MSQRVGRFPFSELEDAQARYGLSFPADLIELLQGDGIEGGYDWSAESAEIRYMLDWPFDMLKFDVENGFWLPDWGERPETEDARTEMLQVRLDHAPRLIPLHAHRFLPSSPPEAGNPVFSMHGFDTIYYGADLHNYLEAEFQDGQRRDPIRRIQFWSDLVDRFDEAYVNYEAAAVDLNRS